VGGFKILEVKLQQTQDRLAAAEAANCSTHEDCISEINRLKDELTACKVKLDMSEMVRDCVSPESTQPKHLPEERECFGANYGGCYLSNMPFPTGATLQVYLFHSRWSFGVHCLQQHGLSSSILRHLPP